MPPADPPITHPDSFTIYPFYFLKGVGSGFLIIYYINPISSRFLSKLTPYFYVLLRKKTKNLPLSQSNKFLIVIYSDNVPLNIILAAFHSY